MKLLVLTHRFPYPPTRGDCIRVWGEVEVLSRQHDVWLACVDRRAVAPEHVAHVRRYCRDVAVFVRSELLSRARGGLRLLLGGSLTAGYFQDRRLVRVLQHWSRMHHFDAVLTVSAAMAPYAEPIVARRRVLDMNDADSWKWKHYASLSRSPMRWLYAVEAGRLAAVEDRGIRAHDVCLLVNERERRKLAARGHSRRTAVSRTGMDLARYDRIAAPDGRSAARTDATVGMLGSMFYAPNVRAVDWFGSAVWPLVKRELPRAQWLIVGSRPTRAVRRWGREAGVTVTGFVPDVRPYLARMDVFVSPVHDEIGVQTKLIEAMAAGRPAVVTPQVAAGIDHEGESPFLVAETPAEFARGVCRILTEPGLARELGIRARANARGNYCVEQQVARIEQWLRGSGTPGSEPGGDRDGVTASYAVPAANAVATREAMTV